MKCNTRSFAVVSVLLAVLLSRIREHSIQAAPISPLSPSRRLRPLNCNALMSVAHDIATAFP
jgi:hypothetical protein